MGGEGVPWIGQSRFTTTSHIFANLGDGTYQHSGLLAVRASIAAKVNITYKILYNDAVAMTGGQPVEGGLTVAQITRQLEGEGARCIVIVTDEPNKYPLNPGFAPGVTIRHRDEMDAVQKEMREIPGTTIIIYDQTCATEKRRRRKRGLMADPAVRTVINPSVCEGCGDCGVQSNCVSIVPLETEFGRKRAIDQSSCNKDLSCVKGFCPSFVTVRGGTLKKPKLGGGGTWDDLPEPPVAPVHPVCSVLVTGVGGTGVVTIGALLGMAAHLEGKGCGVLDMTGLAQKGGAVYSHIRIAARPEDIHTVRIPAGEADLVLGTDSLTTGTYDSLAKVKLGTTRVLVNTHETMPSDFTRKPDVRFPTTSLLTAITDAAGAEKVTAFDATRLATALMGDSIAANPFMLGYAAQIGALPVGIAALERAIELNGVAVEFNKKAFLWGRRAAVSMAAVEAAAAPQMTSLPEALRPSESLDEAIARRADFLTGYQNTAYADRYRALVEQVRRHEAAVTGTDRLTAAVARYAFKLMAYKDEYEVARLYTDGTFRRQIAETFDGDVKLQFNLAPPLLAEKDMTSGLPVKKVYGGWMLTAFRLLAKLKGLRGTRLDIFGYTAERRTERQLISDYETLVAELMQRLSAETLDLCTALAAIPEEIRGFGHVKERHLKAAKAKEAALLSQLRSPAPPHVANAAE
jgi:indolepyruvate ferredoxin oxidoreductase